MSDSNQARQSNDFVPKHRHFNPSDVVVIKNPFNKDVVWQVFDEELKRPIRYKAPAGATVSLTGGLVHTLGLKTIVDEMIQQDGQILLIWDPKTREAYESKVIVEVKESAATKARVNDDSGILEVDLSQKSPAGTSTPIEPPAASAPEFPDAQEFPAAQPDFMQDAVNNLPPSNIVNEGAPTA